MEEVKNVVVLGDYSDDSVVVKSISNNPRLRLTKDLTSADVVVRVWDVESREAYILSEAQIRCFPRQDIPVIFVCTHELVLDAQGRSKKQDHLRAWTATAKINAVTVSSPINTPEGEREFSQTLVSVISLIEGRQEIHQQRQEAQERLERHQRENQAIVEEARRIIDMKRAGTIESFTSAQLSVLTQAAEIARPRGSVTAPVVANVQPASFFGYAYTKPEQASRSHSRQLSSNYAEENLSITEDDDAASKVQKHIMLFALYMSIGHTIFGIGHVNSTLSKALENKLAEELMDEISYGEYKNSHEIDRATIRGKNYDRVSLELKRLLLEKYKGAENILNVLMEIFRCVDSLERGFFSYSAPQTQQEIKDTLALADKVYAAGAKKQRLSFSETEVSDLTEDLRLPSGAIKAVQKLVRDSSVNSVNPLL